MAVDKEDFWPKSFGSPEIETPLEILRKQASLLGGKTDNLVVGEVTRAVEPLGLDPNEEFRLTLYLVAPALDNYRYKLLTVWHGVGLYPVTGLVGNLYKHFKNAAEFKDYLKSQFTNEATVNVMQALIAQSRSA